MKRCLTHQKPTLYILILVELIFLFYQYQLCMSVWSMFIWFPLWTHLFIYLTCSACREALGIASVVAAMLGLSILLLLGVLEWDDCLSEKSAWDTLAWFAVLVGMAGQLTNLGIVTWMSSCVANLLQSFSLSWPAAFGVLQASYFFIHYLFASQTGHVGALYSAFLAMHVAAGVPGVLAALTLAYNTNLFGALTHYSSGQAAVYYGGQPLFSLVTWKVFFLPFWISLCLRTHNFSSL